ncbi:MAG: hypothetical protein AMS24_03315 [Chlamydiae bacterium SM23_39]|nr:MAG: hypothetical protein AMS24_03315 [Chlamydiae bacterium SM23_39]
MIKPCISNLAEELKKEAIGISLTSSQIDPNNSPSEKNINKKIQNLLLKNLLLKKINEHKIQLKNPHTFSYVQYIMFPIMFFAVFSISLVALTILGIIPTSGLFLALLITIYTSIKSISKFKKENNQKKEDVKLEITFLEQLVKELSENKTLEQIIDNVKKNDIFQNNMH